MSNTTDRPDMERRAFVAKTTAAAAVATVAPGVILHSVASARSSDEGVTDAARWGMLIDANKCADGCTA